MNRARRDLGGRFASEVALPGTTEIKIERCHHTLNTLYPNHSMQHMAVCGLSLHQGSTESHKALEQKFISQIVTLNPHGINERFSFN